MPKTHHYTTTGIKTYAEVRTPAGWERCKRGTLGAVTIRREETPDNDVPGCKFRVTFHVTGEYDDISNYVNECLPTVGGVVSPDGTFDGVWYY